MIQSRALQNHKPASRRHAAGQSIVEYAGMIVISTLMVGGMMSGTKQVMPAIFTLLSQRNAMALSDAPPLPAASFPSPAPESSETQISSTEHNGTGTITVPMENAVPGPEYKMQISPSLALTQSSADGSTAPPNPANPASLSSQIAHPAAEPMPAPPPMWYPDRVPRRRPKLRPALLRHLPPGWPPA